MQKEKFQSSAELEQALSRLYHTAEPSEGFDAAWRAAVRREDAGMSMTESRTESKRKLKRPLRRTLVPAFTALVLVLGSLWAGGQDFAASPLSGTEKANYAAPSARGAKMLTTVTETSESADYAVPEPAMYSASLDTGMNGEAYSEESINMAEGSAVEGAAELGGMVTEQKLIRTASLTLMTGRYEADVESVKALLASMGGYVESLYEYGDKQSGDERTLNLITRVPAERLDAFLSSLSGIARVTNRSETATDQTVQYADNQARLETLRTKLKRLNELLTRAVNVSDIVEIESAISDTQYEIDSYETRQRSIDRRVGMSEVSVYVREETAAQSAAAEDINLSARVSAALTASIRGLGVFFQNMLVFVVMALPVLGGLAVLSLIVWLIVRRRHSTGKKG